MTRLKARIVKLEHHHLIVCCQAVNGFLEHISMAMSTCDTVVEQCSSISPLRSFIGRTNDEDHQLLRGSS